MSYTIDKNPINDFINGPMDIWQRGTSFAALATATYTADRMEYIKAGAVVHTVSRDTQIPNNSLKYSLKMDVTTADNSIAAGDYCAIQTKIEGFNYKKYVGQYGTLGFWVRDTIPGIHCVSFKNTSVDRSYVAEYTIDSADTWQYITIPVLFNETGGGWSYANGIGLYISFILAAGSTFHTTANAWQTGNYLSTSSQVNSVNNTANNFYITGISFNVGDRVYSNFNYDYNTDYLRCLRYYNMIDHSTLSYPVSTLMGYAQSTSQVRFAYQTPVPMRATPTITTSVSNFIDITNAALTAVNFSSYTYAGISNSSIQFAWNDVGTPFTAGRSYSFYLSATTLVFNAEL